jgi:hypothetical protein
MAPKPFNAILPSRETLFVVNLDVDVTRFPSVLVRLSLLSRRQTSVPTTHSPVNSLVPLSSMSESLIRK